MAHARRYSTPNALRTEINKYFKSIRRVVEVTEWVPTGKLDDYGHPVLREKKVKNEYGDVIKRVDYKVPPQLTALRLALKVDRTTWGRYASGEVGKTDAEKEAYKRVCEDAKSECERWLRHEKLTRTKGLTGIIHELENHYGDSTALDLKKEELEIKRTKAEDIW